MPLAIQFNNKPATFGGDDLVGRFRSGQQQQGLPRALQEWRVTSDDKEILDSVGTLLGGKPARWDTKSAEVWEVLTKAPSVNIDLEFVNVGMILWGRGNAPIRQCDMVTQKGGQPCECPSDYAERKQAGRDGVGCSPETRAIFRLTEAPDIGKFKFQSGSWGLSVSPASTGPSTTAYPCATRYCATSFQGIPGSCIAASSRTAFKPCSRAVASLLWSSVSPTGSLCILGLKLISVDTA